MLPGAAFEYAARWVAKTIHRDENRRRTLTELRSHQRILRALEAQSIDQGLSPEDVATSSGFPSLKAMERAFSRHCNVSWNAVFVRERKHEDSSHLPRAFFSMHGHAQSGVELETL